MNKFKIIISKEAEDILTLSYDYLYLRNPQAAAKWLEGMLETIQTLEVFPEKGVIIPEADLDESFADLRQIFYKMNANGNTYRIIYKVTKDTCKIVNVITIRSSQQRFLSHL